MSRNTSPFFKGQTFNNVTCSDVSNLGYGVFKVDSFIVFARDVIMDEIADLEITQVKNKFAIATASNIKNKSKHRVQPICEHYLKCNGCKYLTFDYEKQLEIKEKQLKDLFGYDVEIIGANNQYDYRNKSEFVYHDNQFNMYTDANTLTPIKNCVISHIEIQKIMPALLESLNNNKKANVKSVIIRYSQYEDKLMIILLSSSKNRHQLRIAQEIVGYSNKVKSVILNYGQSDNYLYNEDETVLYGEDYLIDTIFNKQYKITSKSFFQINKEQTEKLYNTIIEFGDFKDTDNIADLYCGVGTIAITLSDYVNHVLGVELLDSAVSAAKDNIMLNDVSNVEIIKQDLNEDATALSDLDCVIVDPPRNGLSKNVINNIIKSNVEEVIYVSCNPTTQKRDIQIFLDAGYKVDKHKGVDMFINTHHIESIIKLSRI